jgi:hypothetical protein
MFTTVRFGGSPRAFGPDLACGGQDPGRAPAGRLRGSGLPRLPPSPGAISVQAVPDRAGCRRVHLPGPMALTQGDAARPGPHPVHDHAGPAGCTGRAGRAGDQPVPARLGRVLAEFGDDKERYTTPAPARTTPAPARSPTPQARRRPSWPATFTTTDSSTRSASKRSAH